MEVLGYMYAEPRIIVMLVILGVLLCISAFASASEIALFSLKPDDLDDLNKKGDKRAAAIEKLLDREEYTLASILVLNNLVNICIVILSADVIMQTFEFRSDVWELVFTAGVVGFVIVLFGDVLPKIYANYHNMGFARLCAPVIAGLNVVMKPVAWLLVKSGSKIKGKSRENISLGQLSDVLEVANPQSKEEKQILEGIVNFAGREVGQVMRPRLDVVALDIADGFARVKEVIVQSGFSRIPVYEGNIDHIKGILYIKDVVPHIGAVDGFRWQGLLRGAYFVPENKKIDDLLEEFQSHKVHLAIVVDEYGSTLGLVSLEDILEEIVGEISDESDRDTSFYTKIRDGEYIFEGKTLLGDFERALGLDEGLFDDVIGDAETIAGLLLEIKRSFLKKGESVESHGIRFTVLSHAGRRIDKIKVNLNA